MSIVLDGTTGITTPGLTNTGTETIVNLTTTGNTILGDASTDTLNVGNGGLVKDASGNVGIGTSSPSGRTHIVSAAGTVQLKWSDGTNGTANLDTASGVSRIWSNVGLAFGTGAETYTERMRIDSSGNVGIGTTSPSVKLEVAGTQRITNATQTNSAILQVISDATGSNGVTLESTYYGAGGFGPMKFTTGGSERARIDSSGNLLVGNSTSSAPLLVSTNSLQITNANIGQIILRNSNATAGNAWRLGPDSSANNLVVFNQSNTGVYITNGGTSWNGTSDERVKDIIEPITGAIEKLSGLRTVIGKYKTDEEGTRRSFLIAQDVQAVFPEAVHEKDDELGTLGLAYTDVIPLLVAAIKEQQAIITQLQADVAALKAQP